MTGQLLLDPGSYAQGTAAPLPKTSAGAPGVKPKLRREAHGEVRCLEWI